MPRSKVTSWFTRVHSRLPYTTLAGSRSTSRKKYIVQQLYILRMKRQQRRERSSQKKSKKSVNPDNHGNGEVSGSVDFSSPHTVLESLLSPLSANEFFREHWEKKPVILHQENSSKSEYFKTLFSYDVLKRILFEETVFFERDINSCRYVKGQRESLNKKGRATVSKVDEIFNKKKGTLQFHQPQRFQDELWRIQSHLESLFGSLVGANVYMTPGGFQGLAPHHDDVEVIILQLEGEKHWRLYKPLTELPRDYSRDFDQSEIGKPTHDFTLKAGDVMYFPRGTIHQADTPITCSHSTHVTISTYQHNTWGDCLSLMLPNLLESEMDKSVDFRRGLPLNFIQGMTGDAKQNLKKLVLQLADSIESCDQSMTSEMQLDFITNRLPPYCLDPTELHPQGNPPSLESSVRLRFADHLLIVTDSPDEAEGSDDESGDGYQGDRDTDDDEEMVCVYHSLQNKQAEHMMPSDGKKPVGLKFTSECHTALQQLKRNHEKFSKVADLDLGSKKKENMLMALWSEGLLSTQ